MSAQTTQPSRRGETLLHFFVRQGTPLGDRLFTVGDLLADIDLVHHLVPGGAVGKLFGEPADFVLDGDHALIVTPVPEC
jgi:hypothetical protein